MSDETTHDTQDAQSGPPEGELTDDQLVGIDGAGILKPPSYDSPLEDGAGEVTRGPMKIF